MLAGARVAQHAEGGAQNGCLAERVLGHHAHQALRRLWRPHSEKRWLQPHHLFTVPWPLLLGALLPGTSLILLLQSGHHSTTSSPPVVTSMSTSVQESAVWDPCVLEDSPYSSHANH